MAGCLFGTKPSTEPMPTYCQDTKIFIKENEFENVPCKCCPFYLSLDVLKDNGLDCNIPLWSRGPQRLGWGAELTHTATGEW